MRSFGAMDGSFFRASAMFVSLPTGIRTSGPSPVEGRVACARGDLRERAVRPFEDGDPAVERAEFHDAARLRQLRLDIASAVRAVDRHALDGEAIAAEEEVSNRVLIVEFVVGVGVEQHPDPLFRPDVLVERTADVQQDEGDDVKTKESRNRGHDGSRRPL
jgi:hypothetical protein